MAVYTPTTIPVGTIVQFDGYRMDGKPRKGEVVAPARGSEQPEYITLRCEERSTPDNPVYRTYQQRLLGNVTYFSRVPTNCPV